jgi:hypothetical protein
MAADASRKIPLWSSNRGIQMMVRVALAQQRLEPLDVVDAGGLGKALLAGPKAVLVASEDLRSSGLDIQALAHLIGDGPTIIVFNTARQAPDTQGTRVRVLGVPFAARDLLDLMGSEHPPVRSETRDLPVPAVSRVDAPPASPVPVQAIEEIVREEVRRIVNETARKTVEEMARRLVPELAESLIQAELARLLGEAEDAAVRDAAPDEDV